MAYLPVEEILEHTACTQKFNTNQTNTHTYTSTSTTPNSVVVGFKGKVEIKNDGK